MILLLLVFFSLPAHAVTLLYSNDVLGEIEPCGCRKDPTGGMLRKAVFIEELKGKKPKESFIQIDSGDLFFADFKLADTLQAQARKQAEMVVQAYNKLGHDVLLPGEKDFAAGVGFFEKLVRSAKFKIIAANINKKGKPLLKPTTVVVRDGKKFGFVGVVGVDLKWPEELEITSAEEALKKWVPELKKECDFVFVLSHAGSLDEDRAWAQAVPGIDGVFGAHTQAFLQEPERVGSTYLFQASYRNQFIGLVPLTKPLKVDEHQLTALDDLFEVPEKQYGPLAKSLAVISQKFKEQIARVNSTPNEGKAADSPAFQTLPKCGSCHAPQLETWRKSAHANALASLAGKKQLRNKECLGCHTVGLGKADGWNQLDRMAKFKDGHFGTPEEMNGFFEALHRAKGKGAGAAMEKLEWSWAPVQCENCHQPGRDHPFNTAAFPKAVDDKQCLQCHVPDRSPQWYGKDGKVNAEVLAEKKAVICTRRTN